MNKCFNIMLAVTVALVMISVAAGVYMGYLMQSCSGCGTFGVLIFMAVAIPTLICAMSTLGLWMYKRNRAANERTTITEPKPSDAERSDQR